MVACPDDVQRFGNAIAAGKPFETRGTTSKRVSKGGDDEDKKPHDDASGQESESASDRQQPVVVSGPVHASIYWSDWIEPEQRAEEHHGLPSGPELGRRLICVSLPHHTVITILLAPASVFAFIASSSRMPLTPESCRLCYVMFVTIEFATSADSKVTLRRSSYQLMPQRVPRSSLNFSDFSNHYVFSS